MAHAAVSYIGCVEEVDSSILVALLRTVDWQEEIKRSIKSVEAYESEALSIAQINRRNALTGVDLPPLDLPQAAPFSVDEKRRLARARYLHGLKYREFITEPARILFRPTDQEIRNDILRHEEDTERRRSQLERHCLSSGIPLTRLAESKPIKLPPFAASKSALRPTQIEDIIATASRRRKPLFTRKTEAKV